MSCFACLRSYTCNLYRIVSFHKLHVLDLGIMQKFFDLTNTLLHRASTLHLSRMMAISNARYSCLPQSALLSSHPPFLSNQQDSQAGISGKIRRQSVAFLWVCVMGLADINPEDDILLQCALRLDFVNDILCTNNRFTKHKIDKKQRYFFDFGVQMYTVFKVDVATKFHRLMCHVYYHLLFLVYLGCSSSEENEMKNKHFKCLNSNTIKHLECIEPQLHTTWVHISSLPDESFHVTSDSDSSMDDTVTIANTTQDWFRYASHIIDIVLQLSGHHSPRSIVRHILSLQKNNIQTLRAMKMVCLHPTVPDYHKLLYRTLFAGNIRTFFVDDKKSIHPVMLVVDAYRLKCNYGLKAKFTDIQ